ncbi:biotin carboxylase N-terminal domain-containing protein [Microcella alkaliphila]|uniref:biotin carboxylase n=1 Tax=Microcella alkaliphila TaxID=279828 RepID=A0A0U4WZ17_9MICO|nr:biotin carboxylase N-terminal domain-containing protein [Microcella alkaliphila]BAU32954.1 acetyl/propionyl CoA carboxylase alpha subunit [Microcella alkaliphila]
MTDTSTAPLFGTVLVANRGEIACRVIRTLRALDIRSVAVYSDADADARHVREADLAVRLGPAPAAESYLDIERVVQAVLSSGAEAVHPGYGFLSENTAFARRLEELGVTLIGPPASAIEAMGDKIRAREHVAARGVPVTPGAGEAGWSDAQLIEAADEVGFPLIIKPSGGGGGKGMTVVRERDDLADALVASRRVARSSFGDDTLLIERFVESPRHIEVQVLADAHGTVVHLGERECSLQRRHQKIIEEAPSPLLDEATRAAIGEAACEVARSVDYRGAGTVEFLVSDAKPDEFFFMEMNTRLQVEHPVTELVTGVDLVEQQLRIAAGKPLDLPPLALSGHAVEARLYAEDPGRGFTPQTGTVAFLAEARGQGVRVDSALLDGLAVGSDYDPMLAKVIARGPDRATALARLDAALAETIVLGVPTNAAFLRRLIAVPEVQTGALDTGLIERSELAAPATPALARTIAALVEHDRAERAARSAWTRPSGWRLGPHRAPRYLIDGEEVAMDASVIDQLAPSIRVLGAATETLSVTVTHESRRVTAHIVRAEGVTWMHVDGVTHRLARPTRAERLAEHRAGLTRTPGAADPTIRAAMPGAVVALGAATSDTVVEGQPLVTIEAMKMEHTMLASVAGTVTLEVAVGDQVAFDQVVARIHPDEPEPRPDGDQGDPA